MQMSSAYMAETVEHLCQHGWVAERRDDTHEQDGAPVFERSTWVLQRGEEEHLELEALSYADGAETFYLAIPGFHGLSSHSFPLDSWKHRPDRVEFRYHAMADSGLGHTFVLQLLR